MDLIDSYQKQHHQKKVLIWGLGLQGGGESALRFFSRFTNQIRVTDLKTHQQLLPTLQKVKDLNFDTTLGKHELADFKWADIVLVNQDIFNKAPDSPYLKYILKNHKQLETQTGLFFKLCPCPIIGITGTRGKTTTTMAVASLLRNAGKKIILGGNIPDSDNLASIDQARHADFAVLELSNFQLHGLKFDSISPHIAIITSISPDHYISYQKPIDYIKDKLVICQYQSANDFLIIKKNLSHFDLFTKNTSAQIIEFDSFALPSSWSLKLSGQHNRENLASVFKLAKILNIDKEITKQTITEFNQVKYRLQTIAQYQGVTFVNDTTASSPTAASIALKSFKPRKIIWIAGGNSKKLPINELVETASQTVKKYIFLTGDATANLIAKLKIKDPDFDLRNLGLFSDLSAATTAAFKAASADDTILLSPGFTSFALFANEFERGQVFDQTVNNLINNSHDKN